MQASQELYFSKSTSSTSSLLASRSSNACLPSSSSQYLSPNYIQDELKKRMQTTVAILDENPHKFKILPLKQVPAAQRHNFADSPSMNFERPFVGWRSDTPSLYQLAPSRTGSAYSFHSSKDENSAPTSSESPFQSPAPRGENSAREDSHRSEHSFGESGTGLGFSFRDLSGQSTGHSLDKISGNLSSTSLEHARESSWCDSSSDPDLTFDTIGELSTSPELDTPVLNSSVLSGSIRKAQSMHIRNAPSPGFSTDLDVFDSVDNITLRRMRSKTLTEAVLSKGKGRLHKQKRHAIYADAGMQLALSPPKNGALFPAFPVAVIVSSEGDDVLDNLDPQPDASEDDSATLHDTYRRILHTLDTNIQAETHLGTRSAQTTCLLTVPSPGNWHSGPDFLPISPLRAVKKRNTITRSYSSRNLARTTKPGEKRLTSIHHPIITALLQDVDIVIKEWKIVGRF